MSEASADLEQWLANIEVHRASVVDAWWERPDYRRLRISVQAHPLQGTYEVPGQFVAMGPPGTAPKFFAIASTPDELPHADFLIGRGQETSDGLSRLEPGDAVLVSAALGTGYAMDALAGQEVVVFTTGTGVAAVRPVIRTLMTTDALLHVYYGEDASCRFAFSDEFGQWADAGVVLHQVCAGAGPRRFVQDAYADDPAALGSPSTHFVICGSDPMQQAVRALLAERGVEPARLHFNY